MAVAATLSGVLRGGDTAARFGGDEFAILLEDISGLDEPPGRGAARDALSRSFDVEGSDAFVSASIGIALAEEATVDQEELLRNADVAMYVAKAKGKRRSEAFDPGMKGTCESASSSRPICGARSAATSSRSTTSPSGRRRPAAWSASRPWSVGGTLATGSWPRRASSRRPKRQGSSRP